MVSPYYRQIAGALARRIVNYAKVGDTVKAEKTLFQVCSRIDVIVPNDAKINVSLDQKVKGGETIVAELLK